MITNLKASTLRFENCSSANSSDLYGRHSTRNKKIITMSFHQGDTVGAAHGLSWILNITAVGQFCRSNWHIPVHMR